MTYTSLYNRAIKYIAHQTQTRSDIKRELQMASYIFDESTFTIENDVRREIEGRHP